MTTTIVLILLLPTEAVVNVYRRIHGSIVLLRCQVLEQCLHRRRQKQAYQRFCLSIHRLAN
jgi:hypothetical protein